MYRTRLSKFLLIVPMGTIRRNLQNIEHLQSFQARRIRGPRQKTVLGRRPAAPLFPHGGFATTKPRFYHDGLPFIMDRVCDSAPSPGRMANVTNHSLIERGAETA
ncbi:hypothetical protein AB4037_01845 [Labrys sp. KB_33_2]|uniref:hypothetical protein n=1 Tax=unclassified Labrys (in: a-proteobacteria) TaxID=2688601 RepID=UPI003EB9D735